MTLIEPKPGDARLLDAIIEKARANPGCSFPLKSWRQHVVGADGYCDALAVSLLTDLVRFEGPTAVTLLDLALEHHDFPEDIDLALRLLEKLGLITVKQVEDAEGQAAYEVEIQRDNLVAITYEVTIPKPWELPEDEP